MNASYLGKHNAIGVMFRVISLCGRKNLTSLKLAVENLYNMTKSSEYIHSKIAIFLQSLVYFFDFVMSARYFDVCFRNHAIEIVEPSVWG